MSAEDVALFSMQTFGVPDFGWFHITDGWQWIVFRNQEFLAQANAPNMRRLVRLRNTFRCICGLFSNGGHNDWPYQALVLPCLRVVSN